MKPDLDILIDEYLEERKFVKAQIDDFVKEWNFLEAHYLSIGLRDINRQLQTLQNFKDPYQQEVESLTRRIKSYEKNLLGIPKDRLDQFLQELKDELDTLKKKEIPFRLDTQEIYDLLMDMCRGQAKGFKMNLMEDENLYLKVLLKPSSQLNLSLTPMDQLKSIYLLNDEHKAKLRVIGFQERGTVLMMEVEEFSPTKVNYVIEVLARIVFEAFFYKMFEKVIDLEVYK